MSNENEDNKSNEEVVPSENETEETQDENQDVQSLIAQKKHWREKAKEAEAKLEEAKAKQPPQEEEANKTKSTEGLSREEAIFFAQGGTEEQLEIAKGISMGKKITLAEALNDTAYKAVVEQQSKEAEAKKNQLPASGGSAAQVQTEKSPGEMTKSEHKEWAIKKAQEKLNG